MRHLRFLPGLAGAVLVTAAVYGLAGLWWALAAAGGFCLAADWRMP